MRNSQKPASGELPTYTSTEEDFRRIARSKPTASLGTVAALVRAEKREEQLRDSTSREADLRAQLDRALNGERNYGETLEAIREALGQEQTHYLVMPGDVRELRNRVAAAESVQAGTTERHTSEVQALSGKIAALEADLEVAKSQTLIPGLRKAIEIADMYSSNLRVVDYQRVVGDLREAFLSVVEDSTTV